MIRPPFISLDGPDGAGKSTQCRLLAAWLRGLGWPVVDCTDPGGTALGAQLRNILLNHKGAMALPCEALLFMASRAQLIDEVIRPALVEGKTVVSDRYLLANVVYQGHAGGLDVEKLWRIGEVATTGIKPDLTFLLDIDPQAATARIRRAPDRMESQGDDFRRRLRDGFLAEAARQPDRIRRINADQSIEAVQAEIRSAVEQFQRTES